MISKELTDVISKELDLTDLTIGDSDTADQIPGWDSLSHIQIICAVETAFKIRLNSLEVIRLKTIGDLQSLVNRKLASQ